MSDFSTDRPIQSQAYVSRIFVGSFFVILLCTLLLATGNRPAVAQDADADAKKVMALMRLKSIDVNQKPKLKESVLRHMKLQTEEQEWLKLAERFLIPETAEQAIQIASQTEQEANAAAAMQLIAKLEKLPVVFESIDATIKTDDEDDESTSETGNADPSKVQREEIAAKLASRLRLVDSDEVTKWLKQKMQKLGQYPPSVATALARSAISQPEGPQQFLKLAENGEVPSSIRLAVASALARHPDETIRQQAANLLPLPQAGNNSLPPLEELVQRRGDIANGQKVFAGAGTCAKCHVVNGQGSSVGPDLSEIGNKLARDAMYTAILDPSAAISHNYENYAVQTIDGKVMTGLLESKSDTKVILKSADGVPQEIPADDIEEMQRLDMSLMPADLARGFSESDLVDLVEYLTTLKKVQQ